MRLRPGRDVFVGAVIVALLVLATGAVLSGAATSSSQPTHKLEKTPAARAMRSVFSHPPSARVPANVAAAVRRMAKTAHVGTVIVRKGRLLLSDLGPKRHSIYVFPTTKGEVCFDITRLSRGCKKAFLVGQPASVDGGDLHFSPTSGPPSELAGLTKDGVRSVQVVLHGKRHRAVFGHDAWYYRFPDNHTSPTAATALVLTLADGSTRTVPTGIVKPKLP